MRPGFTQTRFHGGPFGDTAQDMVVRGEEAIIEIPLHSHLRPGMDDTTLSIARFSSGSYDRHWLVKAVAIYEKTDDPQTRTGRDYTFVRMMFQGRCCAVTREGKRCPCAALEGEIQCQEHHEGSAPHKMIENPEFLRVARAVARGSMGQMPHFLESEGLRQKY